MTKYNTTNELVDEPINQPNRRFLRDGLALKIIMDCRTDELCNLKKKSRIYITRHD